MCHQLAGVETRLPDHPLKFFQASCFDVGIHQTNHRLGDRLLVFFGSPGEPSFWILVDIDRQFGKAIWQGRGVPVFRQVVVQSIANVRKHLIVNEADRRCGAFDVQQNALSLNGVHEFVAGFRKKTSTVQAVLIKSDRK